MRTQKITSAQEFLDVNQTYLKETEAVNNLFYGMLSRQVKSSLPEYSLMIRAEENSQTKCITILSEGTLFISGGSDSCIDLIFNSVLQENVEIKAVAGPAAECEVFVSHLERATNRSCELLTIQTLFKLTGLSSDELVSESARLMTGSEARKNARCKCDPQLLKCLKNFVIGPLTRLEKLELKAAQSVFSRGPNCNSVDSARPNN